MIPRIRAAAWLPVAFVLAASGCSDGGPREAAPSAGEPSAADAGETSPAGSVRGVVYFDGEPPVREELPVRGNPECSAFHPEGGVLSEEVVTESGRLANVVVYLKDKPEGRTYAPPADPVTIENRRCVYAPHVASAQTDQPVVFVNADPTLHNIHSYSTSNRAFNLGLPFAGMKVTKKFPSAEVAVTLKCDVHPWMTGYLAVFDHPYHAVTGPDGTFRIEGLPPGRHTLETWHETLGARSQTIEIEPRAETTTEFRYAS